MQRKNTQILVSFYRSIKLLCENYTIQHPFFQANILVIILLVSTVFLIGANKAPKPENFSTKQGIISQILEDPKYIPGITAADVYLALEKKGFTKLVGSNKSWIYNLENQDYALHVFISGDSPEKIIQVKATFISFTKKPLEQIAKDFFATIISLPYKDSNPSYARLWLDKNINGDSTEIIGGVKFFMSATDGSKLLIIGRE